MSDTTTEIEKPKAKRQGKRRKGRGTTFRRADGRWCAQLSLANGRRRCFYGATEAEADAKLTAAKSTINGGGILVDGVTVGALLDRFLEDRIGRGCRPRTMESYRYMINVQIRPALGNMPARTINADDVQAFVNRVQREYSASMARRVLSHVRMVFLLAQERRTVMIDPTRGVHGPKLTARSHEPLTATESRDVLESLGNHPLGAMWMLGILCGLRPGELRGLRWRDLDLEAGVLQVRHTLLDVREGEGENRTTRIELAPPKSARSVRDVEIPPAAVASLKARKAHQAAERLAAGAAWSNDLGLVFTGMFGQPLNRKRQSELNREILKAAGVRHVRPHDHRHGGATQAIEAGVDLATVSRWLGHSRQSFTLDTYVSARKDRARGVSGALATALGLKGA